MEWCTNNVIDPYDAKNGLLNYPIGSFTYDFDMADCTPDSKISAFEIVDKWTQVAKGNTEINLNQFKKLFKNRRLHLFLTFEATSEQI